MNDVFLSEHFRLKEFVKRGTPPEEVVGNLQRLCGALLEPIRLGFDRPIVVTSGWRNKAENERVGGSPTSDHLLGNAADIQIFTDGRADESATISLFHWIRTHCFGRFGQLILESRMYGDVRVVWIHISNITSKHPGAVAADVLFSPKRGVYRRYVDGMET